MRADGELKHHFESQFTFLDPDKRLILVTSHRRENFGAGFENICHALADIAARGDVQVVYPVHLNPNVQESVRRILSGVEDVHLIEPQDYLPFVYLMDRSSLIVTDSGGVQEEAPSLGKPVLVMRDTTERPEAVAAGTVDAWLLISTGGDAVAAADAQAAMALRLAFGAATTATVETAIAAVDYGLLVNAPAERLMAVPPQDRRMEVTL
jgi:UDP-N-acetylglucosamine 2-epimerase (non-hydrolysing)